MITVRRATLEDVDVLVDLRFAFVTEFAPDEGDDDVARASVARYLERSLSSEDFVAWLAEDDGVTVATGGVVVYERMMRSKGAGVGYEGYILNVYTLPAHRRRGHAMRVLEALLEYARERGVRLTLVATDDGRTMYEKLGFAHDDRNYRWWPLR